MSPENEITKDNSIPDGGHFDFNITQQSVKSPLKYDDKLRHKSSVILDCS